MLSTKQVAILAFAGLSYAMPAAHFHHHRQQLSAWENQVGRQPTNQDYNADSGANSTSGNAVVPVNDSNDVVVTITVTAGQPAPTAAPAVAPTTTAAGVFVPVSSSAPQASTPVQPSTNNVGSSNTGSSSGTGYMAVVNKYRAAGGLPPFTQSSKLQANALQTAQDDNGSMRHELHSGSMAQVLAPGNANNFESVYVGGWLCERPNLPGISSLCPSMSQGWIHDGDTGHADILTSTTYTQIGCALATGIWACDLA